MKIASIVRVRSISDFHYIGKLAIVLGSESHNENIVRIHFIHDGWRNSYHKSRLEVIREGR